MRLADFDYPLPPDLVAQTPADRRDASRLLVVRAAGAVLHRQFAELPALLPEGALLLVNDARVVPARLRARKPTGGLVEIFAVERRDADETWACLVRGKGLAAGVELTLVAPPGRAPAEEPPRALFLGREGDEARVRFDRPLLAALERWGEVPLPPYIARETGPTEEDRARYQTVFARVPGAVAAPTAGLHFTDEVFAALAARGIERAEVTLHVGPGTFAPLRIGRDDDIDRHVMHRERWEVPAATAAAHAAARAAGRPIVAVGTTVVRTLESALDPEGRVAAGAGETRLFIRPGHRVSSVDWLITNFHMPRSTLLMLVAAFAGRERILDAYAQAVAARYRFFSYGDAMLLERQP